MTPHFLVKCAEKARKKPKTAKKIKEAIQDLKSQKNAKKCQTTSKTPNSPKFGLEKRHLASLVVAVRISVGSSLLVDS
jgi:hypothetical protein